MGAPQSKLQQPVENLYDALAPSNKTAEVDLLLAGLRTLLSRSIPRYSPSFSLALACCVALPQETHNLLLSLLLGLVVTPDLAGWSDEIFFMSQILYTLSDTNSMLHYIKLHICSSRGARADDKGGAGAVPQEVA
jgi:hypothetical protein